VSARARAPQLTLGELPGAQLWQRPDMRKALATRDIAAVYRLMQRYGVAQRRIAALTGQSQSEISEILNGRQVNSYDVLVRIAQGLGVPRGWLGLAYDDTTSPLVGVGTGEECQRMLAQIIEVIGAATAVGDPDS